MSQLHPCRWYALHVRTNYEATVSLRLRDLGLKEYLPYHRQPAPKTNSGHHRPKALFPGYVFCYLDLDRGPRLCSVTGVLGIVGYGRRPITIEDGEIEAVRRVADCPLHVEGYGCLYTGTPVKLVGGPLAGVSGSVVRINGRDKVVVAVPLLQRSLAVTVPAEWIRQGPSMTLLQGESCA